MPAMKILALNNGYLQDVPSGGDKHLLDVVAAWSAVQEVTLVLPDFARPLVRGTPTVRTLPSRIPHGLPDLLWVYACRFIAALRLVRKIPADVVVCSPGLFDLIPARIHAARYGSVTACYFFHLTPRRKAASWTKRLQYAIARAAQSLTVRICRGVDCVFTDNPHAREELAALGIPRERIRLQTPVVNIESVLRAEPLAAPDILLVGRMVQSKGIFDLVEALAPLPYTAGLIGEGEDRPRLEAAIRARGLAARVTVYGPLPEERLYGLLKGCRLFVLPSYEEGYGIAIAEALVAGKPVLAYDLPHYAEAFNGTVLTVPPGQIASLSQAIDGILRGTTDLGPVTERRAGLALADAGRAAREEGEHLETLVRARRANRGTISQL
jgi:glycosyltransferase involved in cell wall biosynthesis